MLLFLDTEFTSLEKRKLISIGLVSLCGEYIFYKEVKGYQHSICSDFVKDHVLPQLSCSSEIMIPLPEIRKLLLDWFLRLPVEENEKLTVIVDHDYDIEQLQDLLGVIPGWIEATNIGYSLDGVAFDRFLRENNLKPHHALNDARANRYSFSVKPIKSFLSLTRE